MTLKERMQSRMNELGIVAKRSLGQNFLVSQDVVNKIISAAGVEQFAHVWEIGPGLGALTEELQKKAKDFQLIEMDHQLAQYWQAQGLSVLNQDALQIDWSVLLRTQEASQAKTHVLVSNLPYQISARLVIELSLLPQSFDRMVLMFQKEVAQRITSPVGSADYGLLTVVIASFWKTRTLLEAGTRDFFPSPRVASRVVVFERKSPADWFDLAQPDYLTFLKRCFEQRRKKLAPRLLVSGGSSAAVELLAKLKLREDVRPQQLSPQDYISLYRLLKNE